MWKIKQERRWIAYDLTEVFLRYRVGGLIFGGAYTWRGLFSEFYGISTGAKIKKNEKWWIQMRKMNALPNAGENWKYPTENYIVREQWNATYY